MKKFSGHKLYKFPTGHTLRNECEYPYKPTMKGGHTHNHIYNVLFRSTFHKGPRTVGVMKPYYRRVLLKTIEQFGYGVSNGRLILH